MRNLAQEGRVELAIRDLRGLMRGLLERILLSCPKHENTGLESVRIMELNGLVASRPLRKVYPKAKTEIIWAIKKER